ncbi:hypothetical protein GCM10009127_03060 [Alteraurantiacibacter aestuarii]
MSGGASNNGAVAARPAIGRKIRERIPARLWPAILVGYSCLLPKEMSVDVVGANLFPWRVMMILVLPWVIRSLIKDPVRFSIVDLFAGLASLWFVLSLLVMDTVEDALIVGVSQLIDLAFAYIAGRAAIRSYHDFRTFFACLIPGLLAVAAILAAESIANRTLLRPFVGELFGNLPAYFYSKPRFGLTRAMGPFAHPIVAGVIMSSLIPLAWFGARNNRVRVLGLIAAACGIFTFSSAAVLAAILGVGLISLLLIRRHFQIPALTIAAFYIMLMLLLTSVVSESGILSVAIRYLTLDPGSGYYRLLIWNYAGAEALNNPIFGIGVRDWHRPDWMFDPTIDAFWLAITMRHGFPLGFAVLMVVFGGIFEAVKNNSNVSSEDRNTGYATAIALTAFAFCGVTVHIWEGVVSWMYLLAGLSVSLGTQRVRSLPIRNGAEPSGASPAYASTRIAGRV